MGLPVHAIAHEFRETWIDILRQELSGYATVESFDGPTREESPTIYVVGNHGHFVFPPGHEGFGKTDPLILWHVPFLCNAKTHGQDMVNLEERINRAFDKMSVALMPEAIERYENNRWTKFFRLFGWKYVGSLDFAHRQKKEIIEDNFDTEPIQKQSGFNLENYIRCRPDLKESWTEILRQRLEGIATVQVLSEPPRTIVSPNGKYVIETPIALEVKSDRESHWLFGRAENGKYWISLADTTRHSWTEVKHVAFIINATLREMSVSEQTLEEESSPADLDVLPKKRSKVILIPGLILLCPIFLLFSVSFACLLVPLFKPPDGMNAFLFLAALHLVIPAAILSVIQFRALFCCPPAVARFHFGWSSIILCVLLFVGGMLVSIDTGKKFIVPLSIGLVCGVFLLDIIVAVASNHRRWMVVNTGWQGIKLLRKKYPLFRDYWKRELFALVLAIVVTALVCWLLI